MKQRQYKKLCKKAAERMGFNRCYKEDGSGIYYLLFDCGGDDSEWDAEDCWPWVVDLFESDVNIVVDEGGLSWLNKPVKPTPKNVFAWLRNKEQQ